MKLMSILLFSGLLCACASSPKPENTSGLYVSVDSAKNHAEGVDLTLALYNSTGRAFRLSKKGTVGVYLDGSNLMGGVLSETMTIAPGARKKITAHFHFINSPRIYQAGILEVAPTKVFSTCKLADADPDVVEDDGREPADEVQADTCNRALKRPIRVGFN